MSATAAISRGDGPRPGVSVIELVGRDMARAVADQLTRDWPTAKIRVEPRTGADDTVPMRRRRAVAAAETDVAVLVEDTTCLDPGWQAALDAAFADDRVAMAWGPVRIADDLPARYRALGRLEYGRFLWPIPGMAPPGNAFAVRCQAVADALGPSQGIVEADLARLLGSRGLRIEWRAGLSCVYAQPDRHGALLSTRFGHGRIFGAHRDGSRVGGLIRAALAMPVLSVRALRAAVSSAPPGIWIREIPWILAMAAAWSAGEVTGQLLGPGKSERSWT